MQSTAGWVTFSNNYYFNDNNEGRIESLNRRDLFHFYSSFLGVCGCIGQTIIFPSYGRAADLVDPDEQKQQQQRMIFREKPIAPLGALLPVIQQRLLLEAALDIVSTSSSSSSIITPDVESNTIDQLKVLKLFVPPLDYQTTQQGKNQDFRLLRQYNPAKVLRGDLVRASMNLYTTNLDYSTILNKSSSGYDVIDTEWKKSYIRANGGLPSVQMVIGADLDLRYLYRNYVETKIDDAVAELYATDCDNEELILLFKQATAVFDQWLDRVRYGDVRDALTVALSGQTTKVYDGWASPFIPPSTSSAASVSTNSNIR